MDTQEALTRAMLRIQEAHRDRSGGSDLDVGYRTGLLHALNIVVSLRSEHESDVRRQAEHI